MGIFTGHRPTWRGGAAAAVALSTLSGAPPAAATPEGCPDVRVIFARGTFEAPGLGAVGQPFSDALIARLPGRVVDVHAVDYPASWHFSTAAQGIVDTVNTITATVAACPDTRMVLGGYSQGAAVAAYTVTDTIPADYPLPPGITGPMPPEFADHIAAVALFGKPTDGFVDLVQHGSPPIVIGRRYADKTIEMCADQDPVCVPGGTNRSAHSSYKVNGMTDQAADFAAGALNSTP